jgi:predicted dehydrogenase
MSSKRTAAIIGAGTISGNHAAALAALKDRVTVTGVCDINAAAAGTLAEKFSAKVYGDHKTLLKELKPDVCVVCLPHELHFPVGMDVMKAGADLFLEKPMANTVEECRKLLDASEKTGKKIFVGHTHQYYANMRRAKEMIKSGELGNVRMIVDEIIAYYNWENRKAWFLDPKVAGGGVLFNTSPHQIDHLLFLMDSPVVSVRAACSVLRPKYPVMSDFFAFLEYENGVRATVGAFSSVKLEEKARLGCKVLGDKGAAQVNVFEPTVTHSWDDKSEVIDTAQAVPPFELEWREFLDSLDQGRKAVSDGVYGHNVVAVMEAVMKSSESSKDVKPSLL